MGGSGVRGRLAGVGSPAGSGEVEEAREPSGREDVVEVVRERVGRGASVLFISWSIVPGPFVSGSYLLPVVVVVAALVVEMRQDRLHTVRICNVTIFVKRNP